jgi:hypothetical protein
MVSCIEKTIDTSRDQGIGLRSATSVAGDWIALGNVGGVVIGRSRLP